MIVRGVLCCVVLCGEVMEPSPVSSPVSEGVSRQ